MWKVFYRHSAGCMVSRSFNTEAEAQEFIDVNAMVYPLPCCSLVGPSDMIVKDI